MWERLDPVPLKELFACWIGGNALDYSVWLVLVLY